MEKQPLIEKRVGHSADAQNRCRSGQGNGSRHHFFAGHLFIGDAWQIVNDPEIDIVIEMIGGENLARQLIVEASIAKGKHVVTANKGPFGRSRQRVVSNWPTEKRGGPGL